MSPIDLDDPFLTEREVAAILRVNLMTLQKWRRIGIAPPHFAGTRKLVLFRRADVSKWLAERYVEPSKEQQDRAVHSG